MDVLIGNLVNAAVSADAGVCRDSTLHKEILLKYIRQCGITFHVMINIVAMSSIIFHSYRYGSPRVQTNPMNGHLYVELIEKSYYQNYHSSFLTLLLEK